MPGVEPLEIIGAPFTVYVAPVGTAFPEIDDEPAAFDADWFLLGTSGDKNYDDDGVTIGGDQSIELFRGAGSTVPRKAFRTEEDLIVEFNLVDMSPEQWAMVTDDASITTTAAGVGIAGKKTFSMYKGLNVATFALLARGPSSAHADMYAQFELDSAFQSGSPAPQFTKGVPASHALAYQALDASGEGDDRRLVIGTAPAT